MDLTPSGAQPTEASISAIALDDAVDKGELQLLSYDGDVVEWLSECHAVCQADRVSVFLKYIVENIQSTFGTTVNPTDLDHIASEISKSEEAVSAAMTIVAADQKIKDKLCQLLFEQVQAGVIDKGWETNTSLSSARYASLDIDFDKSSICVFKLQFDRANYGQLSLWPKLAGGEWW